MFEFPIERIGMSYCYKFFIVWTERVIKRIEKFYYFLVGHKSFKGSEWRYIDLNF